MLANAGTPLLLAGLFHLVIGNLFIGVLEGLLFARMTKLGVASCTVCFIVANYASAWVGFVWVFSPGSELWSSITVENLRHMFALQVLVAFLWTVLLEVPFVFISRALAKPGSRPSAWTTLKYHVAVQLVSYALLSIVFIPLSLTSALWATVVAPSELLPEDVRVLVLSPGGSQVVEYKSGRPWTDVVALTKKIRQRDRLMLEPTEDHGTWNVVIARRTGLNEQVTIATVERRLSVASVPRQESGHPYRWFRRATDAANHFEGGLGRWQFHGDDWGFGLQASSEGETVQFGFSSPLLGWTCEEVTRLPNDVALFRFGRTQICLYDPATNRTAFLAHGISVLPLLEEPIDQ